MPFVHTRVLLASLSLCYLSACPRVPDSDRSPPPPLPDSFYVYHESGHPWNHYSPSGRMGDIDSIELPLVG